MSNGKRNTYLGCSVAVVLLAAGLTRAQDCDTPALCAGDVNGDGVVNPLDSGAALARLSQPRCGEGFCQYDANCDGFIDPLDIGFISARFGLCLPVVPCDASDCFATGACCSDPPPGGECFTAELPECSILTEFDCDVLGNTWLGADSACEQEPTCGPSRPIDLWAIDSGTAFSAGRPAIRRPSR